jgi:hypothetical protein
MRLVLLWLVPSRLSYLGDFDCVDGGIYTGISV